MFTPFEYTWVSPGKGAAQIVAFIAVFLSVCFAVKSVYPDQPAYPREFEGGLEKELGGKGAIRVSCLPPPRPTIALQGFCRTCANKDLQARKAGDADP